MEFWILPTLFWSNKTWIVDLTNEFKITEGPSLNNVLHRNHGLSIRIQEKA